MDRFFKLAQCVSKNSDHHTHKIGAVVTYKNEIISVGVNKIKTHPKSPHPYFSLHAEMHAIFNSKGKGDTIYIYRETKDGKLALAKPCKYCLELIKKNKIKKVCFTGNGEILVKKIEDFVA